MRLRKHAAALALAAAVAPAAAFGQAAAPRAVQVTPAPPTREAPDGPPGRTPEAPPPDGLDLSLAQPDEQRRAVELYRAHFGGQLTRAPYLGVSTSTVPAALRQHLGLPEGVGLVVEFVEPDSPAQSAGLKQYDIIKRFDDQILVNAQQLAVLVRSRKAGDEVKLSLIRGGKEQTLSAKLVEKEVKELGDIFQDWAVPGEVQRNEVLTRLRERRQRDGGPARTGAAGHTANQAGSQRTMSVWRDNDMTLEMSRNSNAPGRRLVVTDKSGKVLHDINLDDGSERAGLPPNVAAKLKQMEDKLPPGGGGKPGEKGDSNRNRNGKSNSNEKSNADSNDNEKDDRDDDDRDEADDEDDDGDVNVELDVDLGRAPSARGPIGPNDLLHIAIADVHGPGVETVKTTRVRDGRVRLPYVEPIVCQGLTAVELEKQIASAYARAKIASNVNVRVRKVAAPDKPEPRKP